MPDTKNLFEPGTLEKTRKNIGNINKEEAEHMMKVLGGEIIGEKTQPVDPSTMPRRQQIVVQHSSIDKRAAKTPAEAALLSGKTASESSSRSADTSDSSKNAKTFLPNVSFQDWIAVDKLMLTPEYHIKTDYGIFNFVRRLQKNGMYRIDKNFAQYTLSTHIDHLEAFITLIKTIIKFSPSAYQIRIKKDNEMKFRFLRKTAEWNIRNLKALYIEVQENASHLQIQDLFPFIRCFYGMLIQIIFLGERKVTLLLKEIFDDLLLYPDIKRTKISPTIKNCVHEWLYLYTQVAKGLYPLLYCACGGTFLDFNTFFTQRASDILKFTSKSRFDVLLPDSEVSVTAQPMPEPQDNTEEYSSIKEEADKEELRIQKAKKELLNAGLKILETLFPDAGFSHLETFPDFYPYFQPIFEFPDGFNLLSPENPVQFIVIMLRIIEDLFQGCRNIKFVFNNTASNENDQDSIVKVLNEWTSYREIFFDKTYCTLLRSFVAEQYTKQDFLHTSYGKTMQNNMFWLIKYHFLPYYSFDKLVLERPEHNNSLRSLSLRTDFICSFFTEIAHNIDAAQKTKNPAETGVQNPWDHYKFDLPNPLSERLDVLLVAKRSGTGITATNANLIKYTLCICAVLDWWINNENSPAYTADPFKFYRVSLEDGVPQFSVPQRSDQKKLFSDNIKKLVSAQQKKS